MDRPPLPEPPAADAPPAWLVRKAGPDVVSRQLAEAAQRLERVLMVVGAHFGTTPMLLRGPRRERALAQARFAAVALILELCPALSLPCGFTAGGLPVGLQMVARPRNEAGLLAGAHVLEDILGVRGSTPIDPR